MVGASLGIGYRNRIQFCGTFATFYTRAMDHIRMGAVSQGNVKYVGTHVGCSIGVDGPSQMGLEDIALFRSIPECTILYPSDAVSAANATVLAANHQGSFFLRMGRPNQPVFYDNDEKFEIGKCKVNMQGDAVTVVAAGVTHEEAVKASKVLAEEGIKITLIDLFSVKPIDSEALIAEAGKTGNKILVVEDHYAQGGMGDAVMAAVTLSDVKVHHLAV
jgi:transketolase